MPRRMVAPVVKGGKKAPPSDRRPNSALTMRVSHAPRRGSKDPWMYGPYRVVIQRRVTEEEQISIECYEPNLAAARVTYDEIMEGMRAQMIQYNERVWAMNQKKLRQLDRMIEVRGDNVRALDDKIRERREWLLSKGLDASDIPMFEDDDLDNGA